MAEHSEEGRAGQERINEEQHRSEQNKGYGEAAREGAEESKEKTEEQRPFND